MDTLNQVDARRRYLPPMILRGWRGALEAAEHEPPMDWEAHLRQEMSDLRLLHEEGVRFLAGSDFGGVPLIFPGFSLHEELRLLVERAGMTPLEALQTATRNPPIFFGMLLLVVGRLIKLRLSIWRRVVRQIRDSAYRERPPRWHLPRPSLPVDWRCVGDFRCELAAGRWFRGEDLELRV